MEKKAEDINTSDEEGRTALTRACHPNLDYEQVWDLLFNEKADPRIGRDHIPGNYWSRKAVGLAWNQFKDAYRYDQNNRRLWESFKTICLLEFAKSLKRGKEAGAFALRNGKRGFRAAKSGYQYIRTHIENRKSR